jgi:hypothetical protein
MEHPVQFDNWAFNNSALGTQTLTSLRRVNHAADLVPSRSFPDTLHSMLKL